MKVGRSWTRRVSEAYKTNNTRNVPIVQRGSQSISQGKWQQQESTERMGVTGATANGYVALSCPQHPTATTPIPRR